MQKPDLSEPQKFVMADVVAKNSKTGVSQHERLLVIKKGHLYYYSDIPKKFNNNVQFLQTYHELPKCSIQILNIKKINGFQDNSKYFSIEFEARYMMEKEDIRKTMTLQEFNFAPKNKKQTITWQFTCKNQYIKQKWVHTLQVLHAYYSKQKINIEKFFDNINKKQQPKEQSLQPAIRSSMKVPWRQDQLKKSGSNESLRKSQLNNSMITNRSPSNTKKSISSEQKSVQKQKQKQKQRQVNKFSYALPQQQEDLVETFMKIQKTKSAYEPPTSSIIQEVRQSVQSPVKQIKNFKNQLDNNFILQPVKKQQNNQSTQTPFKQLKIQSSTKQNRKIQSQHNRKESTVVQFVPDFEGTENTQIIPTTQLKTESKPSLPKLPIIVQKVRENQQKDNQIKIVKKQSNNTQKQPRRLLLINKKTSISIQQKLINLSKASNIQYKVDFNTNFYELLYFSCNKQYSFQKRIDAQKKINLLIGNFTDKSCKSFIQFVNMKGQRYHHSGRYSQQKISQGISHLQIGYSKYKIAYVTTQAISINGKSRIYYNEVNVKSIKRQMNAYNKLFCLISQNIKNLQNSKLLSPQLSLSLSLSRSQTKTNEQIKQNYQLKSDQLPINLKVSLAQLRVPLCTYLQYKGLCAMAYDEAYKNIQKQIVDKQKLNEWKQLLRILGFNSNCFQFRSVTTSIGELIIAYIINAGTDIYLNQKQKKHHNVGFQSPLNVDFLKKAKKQKASTSIQSLLRYIKALSSLKDTSKFVCPREQIITTLQYCYLCKYLRKFYRAAQAEIDELNFINLLLKGDTNMNKLFQSAGFQFQPIKKNSIVLGIFFQFILYYLGINCQVDISKCQQYAMLSPIGIGIKQTPKKQSINCIKSVKLIPRVIGYVLDGFQLYESFSKIDLYIANNSRDLSEKAIQYKQSAYFQNSYQISTYPWPASAACLYSLAQLNYIQNDYITSIAKSKQFLFTVSPGYDEDQGKWQSPAPSCSIPIYFLMIKCYSKFSRQKFNQSLKELIESTIYNFGQNSSMIITLFSFTGLIFYGIGQYAQAEKFLISAIKICQKLYDKYKKTKLIQLYLDLSKVLAHQNKSLQQKNYLQKAERLKSKQLNYEQNLNFILYSLQSILKMPKSIQSQQKAIQALYNAEKLIKQSQTSLSTLKQYFKLVYQIGLKYNKNEIYEKVIQQLWKMDNNSKIQAVEYAYKLIKSKFQGINAEHAQILQKWSLSKQKSILKIEENIINYKSLLDMMIDVFTEQDPELVPAFLKLMPLEAFRIL